MTLTDLPQAGHRETELPAAPAAPLLPVIGAGTPVPLVTGERRPYANLDYAASAPPLRAVADHVDEILPYYASVHRGAGYASQVSTRVYEGARETVRRFVGARGDDAVVFTRHTTDSLNLLARCLPDDGEVVVLDIEHHADLLPWRSHRVVEAAATLERTLSRLETELARRPAALLAVTGASNVTGEQLPLGLLTRIAHRNGARIVVDGAQLVPHRRIDLVASQVDYLAFSGHKLYAPWGAGVLVGRSDWLDEAEPYLAGGGAVREVAVDRVAWAAAPARHEAGSPNVLGVAALARACQVLAALPEGCLEAHEDALRRRLVGGLLRVPGVEVHRLWPDSASAVGVVAFDVAGHDPGAVAAYLSAEHGVGVRDGRFCAHPLAARLGRPEGTVRASVGAGTTAADVDRLVAAVEGLVRDGAGWTYSVVDGRCEPDPDPRPWPDWAPAPEPSAGAAPCAGQAV
ncbi:selenocysteine lyase/cysteine desulfurase [Haloactinopolyspora alba]|uniref:Selenocysteine lyase/cysteine desulfurase n=1 Tax=Haloactinopolyspora alba TaxID=648780 RepID=A0A2P8E7J4_9ACTN|nr:aminotransferase class V-fold PLP-dependent enzyme [Haloactinopolyspora alba]PSL05442.1 selenocysteine lyase/cysteine desulfurase [Haloactinopolyspora alba]